MIKRLARSVREYWKYAIATPILVALEVVLEVAIPYVMSFLIDRGIDAGNMSEIWRYGIILAVCAMCSLVFGVLAGRTAATASCGFARNLRHDIYYNVQDFSFSNIDRFSTSSLITRMTTDVTNVQQSFQMLTRMAFRAPLMLTFSFIMSFQLSHDLSMIFVACLPVLGIGLWIIMSKAHPLFERVFKTYDKLNNVVRENVRGMRVVKSYVREDYEKEKFDGISNIIFKDFSKAEKTVALNMPLMQLCMYACMIFISWFGARAIVASGNNEALGFTTGQLMSLMSYVMQILMNLMMLSMVFVMITVSRASAERVDEVLCEKSDLTSPEGALTEVKDGAVRFENVSFGYGDNKKMCLKDIDLDIKAGETIGIIGGTGSGKTSFVQLIPRLYDVSEGTVYVGGEDVKKYDLTALRDSVAMVLQKNVLFSGTVAENLRWGDDNATDEELVRACELAQAHDFISAMPEGYNSYIEQGGANVSGGQKQRLCIARALLKKPKILILDDSTSAVDTKTDAAIRAALRDEIPETTKFIIAQRVASVSDADRVIVMDGGRVVDCGAHNDLLERCEIYREVYESQTKGGD